MNSGVVVIGAGSFGAWTAWHLHRAGCKVKLIDAYGPANSRASSGGESRIIRMGYGARDIYTRWSMEALPQWKELGSFVPCGALWIAPAGETHALETLRALSVCGVLHEPLPADQLRGRFPQFHFPSDCWGIYEPQAGALLARRSIQTLVERMRGEGVAYEQRSFHPAETDSAASYVFACGPWLPKLFPQLLAGKIVPSRQEVLFFGAPAGDTRFGPDSMPCWVDLASTFYGIPDLENRGFKIALDKRGPAMDPDTENRTVCGESIVAARAYLAERIPALANEPLVESRVCQYENTADSNYIIDRHPDQPNLWIAGGGSGHGFKHGPCVGRMLKEMILDGRPAEEPFLLRSKAGVTELATGSSL
ncbi:MAG: FAD-dependent oxidoreductase [Candidatus Solibacter usitatus]|nr:FAD-dependent oxidoreductase [Candidatus Solibacter usitatus]